MAKKLCVINTESIIPELGNVRGPILKPTMLETSVIIAMINRGYVVTEVNPSNYNDRIRLSFTNIYSNNFIPKKKKEAPVTHNPFKLPEGRRNTVVEPVSEAKTVIESKKSAKKERVENTEVPVKTSDF